MQVQIVEIVKNPMCQSNEKQFLLKYILTFTLSNQTSKKSSSTLNPIFNPPKAPLRSLWCHHGAEVRYHVTRISVIKISRIFIGADFDGFLSLLSNTTLEHVEGVGIILSDVAGSSYSLRTKCNMQGAVPTILPKRAYDFLEIL